MAFKILNEEQIALLTENQKLQYEDELDIYQARSAFVERMHKLENAEILPYKPKLQNIAVIAGAPEMSFNGQEYIAQKCTPMIKPTLQFRVPEFEEPMSMVRLPEGERVVPVIPKQMPLIPETGSPDIPDKLVFDVPNLSFTAPQMAEPFLPEVVVNITEARSFLKAENPQIDLPTAIKPNIAVKVKKVEAVQAVLPELVKIGSVSVDFEKPEISAAELRPIAKTEPVNVKFEKPEISVAELRPIAKIESVNVKFKKTEMQRAEIPVVSKAEPVNTDFEIPEISAAGLPKASMPDPAVRNIAPVEQSAVNLPAFKKISAVNIEIKPVKRQKVQIEAAPIKITVVKPFAEFESKAEGLPNKTSVHIPNAYEVLREIRPLMREVGALEEISS